MRAVVATCYHAVDLVNGRIGRQSAVKDGELSLQALRDVVATSTRLDHRCQKLQTRYGIECARLRVGTLLGKGTGGRPSLCLSPPFPGDTLREAPRKTVTLVLILLLLFLISRTSVGKGHYKMTGGVYMSVCPSVCLFVSCLDLTRK